MLRFLAAYGILALVSMAAVSFGLFTDDFISVVSNTIRNVIIIIVIIIIVIVIIITIIYLKNPHGVR